MDSTYLKNCNIGQICTTHQCDRGLSEKVAMRWIDGTGTQIFSFADLDQQSNRFASILLKLGMSPGSIFFTFLPKMPEQFFAFLGALKAQMICGTLFSNFGEEALLDRLGDSAAQGIITKQSYLKKILRIKDRLPALSYIILVDCDDDLSENIFSYTKLMAAASPVYQTPFTSPDTPSVLHYTSGSTGKPKGVLHRHGSIFSQRATTRKVLGLRDDDIFWCTADQGWVTGTSYGIIGPWSLGISQVHYGGGYNGQKWMDLLIRERITVWYSAPTALRMLMHEDEEIFAEIRGSSLRSIFSVGEPLNPEVIYWARRVLDRNIYDTWFQTETGAIMITNQPGLKINPGSMGKPVESIEVAIISDEGDFLPDNEQGNLCLKPGWPSMFVTYLNNEPVYRQKFRYDYYFTGDTAWRDKDGYYWFTGRSDDVINTAGHLVSPFEVESALLEMPEVIESGVIGAPDDLLFEKVVAYIHLRKDIIPTKELELKLRLHISNKLSSIATPQEVVFCDAIPKNKSGKIMRRVIRARYLGIDAGDTSTLEM